MKYKFNLLTFHEVMEKFIAITKFGNDIIIHLKIEPNTDVLWSMEVEQPEL